MKQPWGGKAKSAYRSLMRDINRELHSPMERCPSCEEPGYPTLLAWPERTPSPRNRRRGDKLRKRYGLCVLCGHRFIIFEELRRVPPGSPPAFTPEQCLRIREMYEQEGFTCPELAEFWHCCQGTIRNVLKRQGVKLKHGGSKKFKNTTHQEMETIRFLYENLGWSQREISSYTGLTYHQVQNRVKQGGFKRRDQIDYRKIDYTRNKGNAHTSLV